jgi:hypothetical protein
VAAAEDPVLPIRAGVDDATARQFLLHLHKNFTRNDGFVAVFHVILRHKAVVLDTLFGEEVYGVGFLQKGVADVFFIPKNCADVAGMPPFPTRAIQNTVRLMHGSYNWTATANYNEETLATALDREFVKKFADEFMRMYAEKRR